ncbi:MAG: hypothetical protein HN352_02210 [Bacteroidetes bacterium]|jgi:hypothetical protein|nr:hypothetical protein [Bacteroidota bacterium]MBT3750145.1 hypothetical protein [Bacteroidota bacterium]MBT4402097.1 hypothetical protein [Bacteroidota bacterium]MBT4412043.1 hypothetical protein [Bacteroidota bacterium]MBT7095654.1 hypothetical protein [Bacteroidota bacterium]
MIKISISITLFCYVLLFTPLQGQEQIWTTTEGQGGVLLEKFEVLKRKKHVKHGQYERYYRAGQTNIVANFTQGKLDGKWSSLHWNGKVAVKGTYRSGDQTGIWQYFDTDGTERVMANFYEDSILWTYYGPKHDSIRFVTIDGELHANWEYFNEELRIVDPESDSIYPVPQIDPVFIMTRYSAKQRIIGPVPNEPAFAIGIDAFNRYLKDYVNLPRSLFPSGRSGEGIKKTCYIQLTLNQIGDMEKLNIIRSFSKQLDKELKRVIEEMPLWFPALDNGRPVKTILTIPYTFQATIM